MNKILNILYKLFLSLFEFIIDLMIVVLSIYFIRIFFGTGIIIDIISFIILLSGLTYGFNDMINSFKEKNK